MVPVRNYRKADNTTLTLVLDLLINHTIFPFRFGR
jgi:hypothetical protein